MHYIITCLLNPPLVGDSEAAGPPPVAPGTNWPNGILSSYALSSLLHISLSIPSIPVHLLSLPLPSPLPPIYSTFSVIFLLPPSLPLSLSLSLPTTSSSTHLNSAGVDSLKVSFVLLLVVEVDQCWGR